MKKFLTVVATLTGLSASAQIIIDQPSHRPASVIIGADQLNPSNTQRPREIFMTSDYRLAYFGNNPGEALELKANIDALVARNRNPAKPAPVEYNMNTAKWITLGHNWSLLWSSDARLGRQVEIELAKKYPLRTMMR